MSDYKYDYDNPDDAYQEALRRIKWAKDNSADLLDLSILGLTTVPPEIALLTNVQDIRLNGNELTTIPLEISQLNGLIELDLRGNQLTSIPPEIGQLRNLKILAFGDAFGGNKISQLPPEIGDLTNLTSLVLPYPGKNGELIMLDVQELLNGVSTSAMRQAGLPSRGQLLADLRSGFNAGEFYGLLFALGINKNDIGGETIADQMRECVAYMERHNRMAELVAAIRKNRPRMGA